MWRTGHSREGRDGRLGLEPRLSLPVPTGRITAMSFTEEG
jgi:hypothetical protein